MRPHHPCGTGLLLAALVLPTAAADDKPDAGKAAPAVKVETKEKLASAGEFTGKLLRVNPERNTLTVQLSYLEIDPNRVRDNQNHMIRRQLEISRVGDLRERAKQTLQLQVEMQRRQRDVYRQVNKNVDLQAAEELVVRLMQPPVEFDEKGRPRRLTDKEKRALQGPDPKLPGYTAEFENLKANQVVRVTLARRKEVGKPKEKDFLADGERPQVKMIVILADPER